MKRTTNWGPDTCGCLLEIEWDDSQDENTRQHTIKEVKLCPVHGSLSTQVVKGKHVEDDSVSIVEENRRKNKVFGMAQEAVKEFVPENYLWFYDNQRVLNVTLTGLTGQQKAQLRSKCDASFGENKVKVL